MTVVVIETLGIPVLQRKLRGMAERSEDVAPAFEIIATDIYRIEEQVFLSQGRRGGGSWQFLQPETLERKLARGGSPLILIDTGNLMESVTEEGGENVLEIGPDTLVFGTTHPAARSMQFGDEERGIPARPFFNFTEFDRQRWARIIRDWIAGRL